MRTIKFRAWDRENKEWCEDFVGVDIEGKPLFNGEDDLWPEVEINQFTGLLDKNGKEIYEGDLIQGTRCGVCKVVFENGGFKIEGERGSYDDLNYGKIERKKIEVIGNVYDNPSLLTQ